MYLYTWTWSYGEEHAWAIAESLDEARRLLKAGNVAYKPSRQPGDYIEHALETGPDVVWFVGTDARPAAHYNCWGCDRTVGDAVFDGEKLVRADRELTADELWSEMAKENDE